MRYIVNGSCVGCGLCTGICPEVFTMTDEGVAKAIDEEVDRDLATALDAMQNCPVQAIEAQVVSRTLAQNPYVSVTLFAFAEGEEISTHDSAGDAMVQVLEGTGRFTVGGEEHLVHAGEALVMPAGIPHAVFAPEAFKMLLTVVFPTQTH